MEKGKNTSTTIENKGTSSNRWKTSLHHSSGWVITQKTTNCLAYRILTT